MALTSRKKRWLLISLIGIVVLCIAITVVVADQRREEPSSSTSDSHAANPTASASETPEAAGPASPSPASPPISTSTDDGTRGDDGPRDSPVPTPSQQGDDGRHVATVTLTSWGMADDQLDASGFVPGVVENSGTCTLTASNRSSTLSAEGPGNPAASTTACAEGLAIPRSSLHPGTWKVSITYSSPGFSGTSDSQTIEVE